MNHSATGQRKNAEIRTNDTIKDSEDTGVMVPIIRPLGSLALAVST